MKLNVTNMKSIFLLACSFAYVQCHYFAPPLTHGLYGPHPPPPPPPYSIYDYPPVPIGDSNIVPNSLDYENGYDYYHHRHHHHDLSPLIGDLSYAPEASFIPRSDLNGGIGHAPLVVLKGADIPREVYPARPPGFAPEPVFPAVQEPELPEKVVTQNLSADFNEVSKVHPVESNSIVEKALELIPSNAEKALEMIPSNAEKMIEAVSTNPFNAEKALEAIQPVSPNPLNAEKALDMIQATVAPIPAPAVPIPAPPISVSVVPGLINASDVIVDPNNASNITEQKVNLDKSLPVKNPVDGKLKVLNKPLSPPIRGAPNPLAMMRPHHYQQNPYYMNHYPHHNSKYYNQDAGNGGYGKSGVNIIGSTIVHIKTDDDSEEDNNDILRAIAMGNARNKKGGKKYVPQDDDEDHHDSEHEDEEEEVRPKYRKKPTRRPPRPGAKQPEMMDEVLSGMVSFKETS